MPLFYIRDSVPSRAFAFYLFSMFAMGWLLMAIYLFGIEK